MRIKKRLGEALVDSRLITEPQLLKCLGEQKKSGMKLGQFLIHKGIVKEKEIIDVLSQQLNIEKYDPNKYPVDPSLADIINGDIAQKYQLAPLQKLGRLLKVAMLDPMDIKAMDTIEVMTNREVEPLICTENEINQLIGGIYGSETAMGGVLESIEDLEYEEKESDDDIEISSLHDMAGEAPVIRLVNSMLSQAVREGASDIHISPEAKTVQTRFRIDGKLHNVPSPPKSMVLSIISRIKILANMDIANFRIPQDGRFSVKMGNRYINLRVSSLPTVHGENIVIRLLDTSAGVPPLSELGFTKRDFQKILDMIVKPYGMILATGPTGSGKSTTLFSILKQINEPDINIITLEDPVEYQLENIRQVQLNTKAGMTFSSGLRSILRQDPDVILVGEIRDAETANIAAQAALTGHRVLSTLHTNTAAGAITRLSDMGIEPFLVSSVLLVVIAQRLIRAICPYCKESYTPPDNVLKSWGLGKIANANFRKGKGCNQCMNIGYKGRTGVYEVLVVDTDIQTMIVNGLSTVELTREARRTGKFRTLKESAATKAVQGVTTLEEAATTVVV